MEQRQREVLGKGLVKVLSSQTRYPQSSARAAEKGWAKTWDARMRLADNSFIDFGSSHQAGNNPGELSWQKNTRRAILDNREAGGSRPHTGDVVGAGGGGDAPSHRVEITPSTAARATSAHRVTLTPCPCARAAHALRAAPGWGGGPLGPEGALSTLVGSGTAGTAPRGGASPCCSSAQPPLPAACHRQRPARPPPPSYPYGVRDAACPISTG